MNFPNGRDLELLAASGASVAHCPWVFARRGIPMQSYARYLRAGVNMALGTDTFPQDMLHEMQIAAVVSKLVESDPRVAQGATERLWQRTRETDWAKRTVDEISPPSLPAWTGD